MNRHYCFPSLRSRPAFRQLPLLLALLFALSARSAGYFQTISYTGHDVTLEQVFAAVKKQTGIGFFYPGDLLKTAHRVSIDVKNVSLEEFLDILLRNQSLAYRIAGQTVFISKKEEAITATPQPGQTSQDLKGRVTNTHGEPIPNANITVKRTGRGTVTNANGEFLLKAVTAQDLIMVSFIGYRSQTLPVKGRSFLSLILDPAADDLDKVVVQAYGATSQRLATGNISSIRAEDIEKQPVVNVLNAIQGMAPGAVVTNTSGYGTGTIKVEIRGRNSIGDFPADPLYIIDGVPLTILDLRGSGNYESGSAGVIQSGMQSPASGQSPFFSINPGDIESIEVLKDADATAIYGSRAANGVILITTKKGKPGKAKFDMDVYTGIMQNQRKYQLLNTAQYVSMRKEALINDGLPLDSVNAPDLVAWDPTRYTDWQKYCFDNLGHQTQAEASIAGGDSHTTFRLAGAYSYLQEILVRTGSNQRGNLSLNLNHKSLNEKLSLSFTGFYTTSSINETSTPPAVVLPPNAPAVYDSKGNLNYNAWAPLDGYYPFASILQPYNAKTNLLNSNLIIGYELIKGLQIKTSLGYNNIQTTQVQLTPVASQDPASNPQGSSQIGYTFVHNLIIEPQAEYNRFLAKGRFTALAGASYQSNHTSSALLNSYGYTNDALLTSLGAGKTTSSANFSGDYQYAGVFSRINYNWNNKYILNLNLRRDGSSHFGPGRQFGTFYSVGSAWVFTEEPWLKKNLPYLSWGKIRGSYGTTGGDQIANYAYLSQWSFYPGNYNGVTPVIPLGHTDSTIHWQVNRKLEIALDLGFIKDRLGFELAWYRDRCNDQLIPLPSAPFTGFSSVNSNSPANVQNTGFEIKLNGKIIDNQHFNWNMHFNIAINRNKLLAYPNLSLSPYAGSYIIGKPLNMIKVLHSTGVDTQTGLYTFQDLNHDGTISIDFSGRTTDDRYPLDLTPRYDGGLINDLRWNNWQLSFFFHFRRQKGRSALATVVPPGGFSNQPLAVYQHHWQKPGDIAPYAKFSATAGDISYYYFQSYSDGIYTDASYVRLKNISITYSLPDALTKKYGLHSFKLYLQGENILLITKYKGSDPEIQTFGALPIPRVLTAGIRCSL